MSEAEGMTELLARYNELAVAKGKTPVESFKSLKAARAAIATLEKTEMSEVNTEATEGEVTGETGDRSKYNSSGKRGPNQGVGAFCKERIVAGLSNADIVAEVLAQFPGAKTTASCVAFYRTALKKGAPGVDAASLRAKAAEMIAKAEAAEAAQAAADAEPVAQAA